jgi:hypothetical protein
VKYQPPPVRRDRQRAKAVGEVEGRSCGRQNRGAHHTCVPAAFHGSYEGNHGEPNAHQSRRDPWE